MSEIVTRFPPSPTGYLHLGGARTAIFNWLYARRHGGKFVLRFEDTDLERSTAESVEGILDALKWLSIDFDEGPYFQSKRIEIYRKAAQALVESGHAYYCTCPPQRLEKIRKEAMAKKQNPRYDGLCRDKGLGPVPGAVIRFRSPENGVTVVEDRIRGNIAFSNEEIDDFIIVRSDGTPTYNLAVVVDDMDMGITIVIRGDDHLSNTPKQILLYKALGATPPGFAHVPMVLGPDKTRLSKRHGAMSVTAYREMGYLPDAMINFLVRLGWSYGDQEFFTRKELMEKFDLDHVGKSAGVFNPDKLLAINAEHIRAAADSYLAGQLVYFLEKEGIKTEKSPLLERIVQTLKQRSKTLVEMAKAARFYFIAPDSYDEKGIKKFFGPDAAELLEKTARALEGVEPFDTPGMEKAFSSIMEETGLKFGKIAQPVRLAVTGATASPGIFEMLEILGRDETVARLQKAAQFIRSNA